MNGGLARRSPEVALTDLADALTRLTALDAMFAVDPHGHGGDYHAAYDLALDQALDAWAELVATEALADCVALLAASHAGVPQ